MNNSFFTSLLLILVAIGLAFFYLSPGYTKIQELQAKQTQFQNAVDQIQEIQSKKDELLSKMNSFSSDDLSRLQVLLPDDVDNVRLALDISTLADNQNITIKNIRITKPLEQIGAGDGSPNGGPAYGEVQLTFAFKTTYDNFKLFMADLEKSLRIIDVSTVTFRSNTTSAIDNQYDFNVAVWTYWLKPTSQNVGAVPQPTQ